MQRRMRPRGSFSPIEGARSSVGRWRALGHEPPALAGGRLISFAFGNHCDDARRNDPRSNLRRVLRPANRRTQAPATARFARTDAFRRAGRCMRTTPLHSLSHRLRSVSKSDAFAAQRPTIHAGESPRLRSPADRRLRPPTVLRSSRATRPLPRLQRAESVRRRHTPRGAVPLRSSRRRGESRVRLSVPAHV